MDQEGSWRTDSAYDYTEHLSPSDLAWEFLRRNEDYRREYSATQAGALTGAQHEQSISDLWGLSFRGRPFTECAHLACFLGSRCRSFQGPPRPLSSTAAWHFLD